MSKIEKMGIPGVTRIEAESHDSIVFEGRDALIAEFVSLIPICEVLRQTAPGEFSPPLLISPNVVGCLVAMIDKRREELAAAIVDYTP